MTRMASRRPVTAAAVFVVAVLLFGGIAGLVQAGDGEATVDAFRTVVPERGERGSYTAVPTGAWTEAGEEPFTFLSYTWVEDEVVRGKNGTQMVVNRVDVVSHLFQDSFASDEAKWVPIEAPARFDPATGGQVEFLYTSVSDHDLDPSSSVPAADSTSNLDTFIRFRSPLAPEGWRPDCLFRHPFQTDIAQDPFLARCSVPGLGHGMWGGAEVVGRVTDPDFGRVLHVKFGGSDDAMYNVSLELWYAPSFSVPVRFSYWSDFEDGGLDAVLTGHEPGAGPLPDAAKVDPDPLSPIRLVPRSIDGLDDPGHVYPLAQALADAADWQPYADYRAVHPDAEVYQAGLTKHERDTGTSWEWGITLDDEGSRFGFSASRPQPVLDTWLPVVEDASLREVEEEFLQDAPVPGSLPDEVPVLADLFTWHEAFKDERPQTWSFELGCVPMDLAIDCVPGSVSVGNTRLELSYIDFYVPGGPPGLAIRSDGMAFGLDGAFWHLVTVGLSMGQTPNAYAAIVGGDGQEDAPVMGSVGGFWSPPSPAQAAGVGFLALVLAGLYYFWPSIKALPFLGGFSRLKKDEIEDHPNRAAIMEAVRAEPGLHFQQIRRRTGLANGSAVHHISQLEAKGLLSTRKTGAYTCYFARGEVGRDEMDAAGVARSDGARRVLDAVRDWPGASNGDIARVTGLSAGTVSHHLRRLGDAGAVTIGRGPRGLEVQAA